MLAVKSDKENMYNALIRTGCVQLKRSADICDCKREVPQKQLEEYRVKAARIEEAMAFLRQQTELYNIKKAKADRAEIPKNSFARPKKEVDYDFFLGFGKNSAEVERQADGLDEEARQLSETDSQLLQLDSQIEKYLPYEALPHPTTWYRDTVTTLVRLCQVHESEWEKVLQLADTFELVSLSEICRYNNTVVACAAVHRSEGQFLEQAAALGMVKVTVACDVLPKVKIKELAAQREQLVVRREEITKRIVDYDRFVPQWKMYVDYVELCAKKAEADGDLQVTECTYVMEGYFPAEKQQTVENAICGVTDCNVTVFEDIGEEEFAPTLVKNNPVTRQFEFVTNMYTPPEYHEIDPNPVMSVFYFIIFGLMVADVGYGLVLLAAGLFAHFAIKQQTGLRTMLQLFGICGVSAIIVGLLFGSCFSYTIFDQPLIPDPSKYPMVMMIISLFTGVIHLAAGIGCNMAVKIKHKQALSAWLTDFPWIIVLVSLILAIFNGALDMAAYPPYESLRLPDKVSEISLYVCLGSLAVGVIFAGLGTKGFFGKISKSFGSVYGLINYFSDIMSYIRVFGLMLSSALMGVVINQLGAMVSAGGGIGYLFAAMILVFAHVFNLAMGILGVYIHNGRLQYVEFFGKFYTGDGQLFLPFGSDTKYVLMKNSGNNGESQKYKTKSFSEERK